MAQSQRQLRSVNKNTSDSGDKPKKEFRHYYISRFIYLRVDSAELIILAIEYLSLKYGFP